MSGNRYRRAGPSCRTGNNISPPASSPFLHHRATCSTAGGCVCARCPGRAARCRKRAVPRQPAGRKDWGSRAFCQQKGAPTASARALKYALPRQWLHVILARHAVLPPCRWGRMCVGGPTRPLGSWRGRSQVLSKPNHACDTFVAGLVGVEAHKQFDQSLEARRVGGQRSAPAGANGRINSQVSGCPADKTDSVVMPFTP